MTGTHTADKKKKCVKYGVIIGIIAIVVILAIVLPIVLSNKGTGQVDLVDHYNPYTVSTGDLKDLTSSIMGIIETTETYDQELH